MKIIDQLIEELTDKNIKLTDVLIKAKVLAFKLKNQALGQWIECELNGYRNSPLPEYRIVQCQVIGTISNGFQRANNYPIPLSGLDKEIRESLLTLKMDQSISSLEEFTQVEGHPKLAIVIPADLYGYMSQNYDNGFVVEYARREIGKEHVIQALTSVRSKLLDFLLQLNEEVGDQEDIKSLTEGRGKQKVNNLFEKAVFGDNVTIIVGDHNSQTVTNSNIKQGNFEELAHLLSSHGVNQKDIQELESIIDKDNPNPEKKEFGDKVKGWMKNMLDKAIDTTWKIGIGVAGKLLADGIMQYYGWK